MSLAQTVKEKIHDKDQYDLEIERLSAVIKCDPSNAGAYRNRGYAYGAKGQHELAEDDFAEAVRLDNQKRSFVLNEKPMEEETGLSPTTYSKALNLLGCRIMLKGQILMTIKYQHDPAMEEFDLAIKKFTEAIGLDATYSSVFANRGDAHREKGQYDLAIADFTEAIRLDPKNAKAYSGRGEALSMKGSHDSAIADHDEAITLNPTNARAYISRGKAHGMKGRYDKAIKDFTKSIGLDPEPCTAYCHRGNAYMQQRQYDFAIMDFTKAVRRKPNYAEAYCGFGNAYLGLGQYDSAIKDFSEAIRLDPESAALYKCRGMVHERLGNKELAAKDYAEAARLDPTYAKNDKGGNTMTDATEETIKLAGNILSYSLSSKPAEIENAIYLKTGCKVDLKDTTWKANTNLAEDVKDLMYKHNAVYSMTVYPQEKRKIVVINRRAGNTWVFAYFMEIDGSLYDTIGGKAMEALNKAIGLNSESVDALRTRGSIYWEEKRYDLAIKDFTEVIKLDPKDAFTYSRRGSAYMEKGQYDLAIEDLAQAIRLDPEDAFSHSCLEYIRKKKG